MSGNGTRAWLVFGLCGCAPSAPPMPHVPVKQEYAVERAAPLADESDFALHPALGERLLRVEASGVSERAVWRAVFYSDGTLQAEARPYEGPAQRSSAKLSEAELQRLKVDMPALELCRRHAEACIRDNDEGGAYVVLEILSGPLRGHFAEHVRGARAPTDFLRYEAFVVGLIAQTLGEVVR